MFRCASTATIMPTAASISPSLIFLLEAKQAFKNPLEVSPNHFQMKICAFTIGSKGQLTL
jgi:hypothetical protein